MVPGLRKAPNARHSLADAHWSNTSSGSVGGGTCDGWHCLRNQLGQAVLPVRVARSFWWGAHWSRRTLWLPPVNSRVQLQRSDGSSAVTLYMRNEGLYSRWGDGVMAAVTRLCYR